MAQGNCGACMPVIFGNEGGLSMLRADPGNWTGGRVGAGVLKGTNMGIAASAHPTLDIAHLTKAEATRIYETEYWAPAGCEALARGLDLAHFDATVQSGRGNSARWLKTSASAAAGVPRVHAYCGARLHSLEGMRVWASFGKGLAVRVARTEAAAVKMASATPAAAAAALASQAAAAATTSRRAAALSHASGAAAGASVAIAATSHPALGVLAALLCAVTTVYGAFHASVAGTRAATLAHAAA